MNIKVVDMNDISYHNWSSASDKSHNRANVEKWRWPFLQTGKVGVDNDFANRLNQQDLNSFFNISLW